MDRVHTFTTPEQVKKLDLKESQVFSCRFLLSLSVLDALMWITGKMVKFEVQSLHTVLGLQFNQVSVLLTCVHTVVSFVGSISTPQIYRWVTKATEFRARDLAQFTLRAYNVSSLVALVFYPLLFTWMYVPSTVSAAAVIGMAIVQNFQYGFLNQIGDASTELATPHWLPTFEGVILAFPGFPLLFAAKERKYRFNLTGVASSQNLAVFLILLKVVLTGAAAVIYSEVQSKQNIRVSVAIGSCFLAAIVSLVMMSRVRKLTSGIANRTVEDDSQEGVRWLWKLEYREVVLVFFYVFVFSVGNQSSDALMSVFAQKDIADTIFHVSKPVLTIAAAAMLFVYIIFQVISENKKIKTPQSAVASVYSASEPSASEGEDKPAEENKIKQNLDVKNDKNKIKTSSLMSINPATGNGPREPSDKVPAENKITDTEKKSFFGDRFDGWLLSLWCMVFATGCAGLLFYLQVKGKAAMLAPVLVVCLFIAQKGLQAKFTSFLMEYPAQRSSDIMYWSSVCSVGVSLPVLGFNWYAIDSLSPTGEVSNEELLQQNGLLLLVLCVILLCVAFYMTVIDRCGCLPDRYSVSKMVNKRKPK